MTESTSPEAFLSAAPASPSGSSPFAARYAAEIKRAWLEHAAGDARTLQRHLGPSELGVECDRQVVGKMAGLPQTNHVSDPWPSISGRALHRTAEDVFAEANRRHGPRWITEQRVVPHPDHAGTADLYDGLEQAVVDHKFLGESSMAKIRRGVPRKYEVQLLLYGVGYLNLGLPVRRVVLVAYPRTAASLDGIYVWDREFAAPAEDGDLRMLPDVVELLEVVHAQTAERTRTARELAAGRLVIDDVATHPDSGECFFCPFYRPQSARDGGPGCPGGATG